MSSVIKVNACVYSRIGYGREHNTNSFYMNGKFTSEQHIENVQAAMENRGLEYLFAVSDNMVCADPEQEINISIQKELGRFHEKITVNNGDIRSKMSELESRVNDTERLVASFLEMNRIPVTDPAWNLGVSALLLSDGKLMALTGGEGRIYMMRDGRFRPLAAETSRAKRELENKAFEGETEEDSDIMLPGEEEKGSAIVSDIYDINEGDSFILLSKGLFDALGEEKIEDVLALRSDSTYIAHRLVDEGMKRKTEGDLTALVVQVEKVVGSQGPIKKAAPRNQPKQQNMRSKVDRLNKAAPAVTYKYNKRKTNKYQSSILVGMVFVTVLILFGIIFLIINSLMNTGIENVPPTTPPTTETGTPTGTPPETDPGYEDPDESPTSTPTPTPTPPAPEVQTHVVKQGDSISSIARTYYGDVSLVDALCKYNNIPDPNKIILGQEIKIPPKEVLKNP